MSNIPWPHGESPGQHITVGYVENSDLNENLRELSRQCKEMLDVSMDLQRSNQEMEMILKNKEKCSCRETVIKELSETQLALRKLDERCKVEEHDIHTLATEVSNLNHKVDILYAKASGNQDYLPVAKNPHLPVTLVSSEDSLDTSCKETAINELPQTDQSTENNQQRIFSDVVDTCKADNELSDAPMKKYYDLTPHNGKGTAVFFDDLYNNSVRSDNPSCETTIDKQQNVSGSIDDLVQTQKRQNKSSNDSVKDNTKRIPLRTKPENSQDTDTNNFEKSDDLPGNKSNIPDWHSPTQNNVIEGRKHSERTEDIDNVTSHEQDSSVSTKGTEQSVGRINENTTETKGSQDIDTNNFEKSDHMPENKSNFPDWRTTKHNNVVERRKHSERKEQIDNVEQVTSHEQNSRVPRQWTEPRNTQIDENSPNHPHSEPNISKTAITGAIKQPATKKTLKRIFTSTIEDNRTIFQTKGNIAPSVSAGEYLYYPLPEESNIKVNITPRPNIEWSGRLSDPIPQASAKISTPTLKRPVHSSIEYLHKEDTSSSLQLRASQGPSTILCLDVSENMRGRAFQEMIATAKTIITGAQAIAEGTHSMIEEKIAIATFGQIVVHMTNDYHRLLSTLDTLTVGGISSIQNGLMVCLAVLSGTLTTPKDIEAKIVIISDGRDETQGTESVKEQHTYRGHVSLWSVLHDLKQRAIRVFCVPVGEETRLDTFQSICDATQGKVIQQSHTHHIVKMSQALHVAVELAANFDDMTRSNKKNIIREMGYASSEEDLENIVEQLEFVESRMENEGASKFKFEEFDPNMPEIGTRVRRGPDWNWENQDSEGPGTVIGHNVKGMVWVEWDNGISNRYHYKANQYDVIVVEEPRQLFNELIAVGCVVKRGISWSYGDQDGGPGNHGVVIRVVRDGTILVRWQNKKKYTYKFGCDGIFDVATCEPYELVKSLQPPSSSNDNIRRDRSQMQNLGATGNKSNEGARSLPESNRYSNTVKVNGKGATKQHETQNYPQPKDQTAERSTEAFTETVPVWQYYHENEKAWLDFPPEQQEKIEKTYNSKVKTTTVTVNSERYRITFESMTYNNMYTNVKTKLPLRRN